MGDFLCVGDLTSHPVLRNHRCMTTVSLTPPDFSLDAVVERLSALGIPAYVEQTGGGCATIYAGATHEEAGWGPRYQAVAGPGWFNGPGWSDGRGSVGDFYVGPDDDGESLDAVNDLDEGETDPIGWTVQRISALVNA